MEVVALCQILHLPEVTLGFVSISPDIKGQISRYFANMIASSNEIFCAFADGLASEKAIPRNVSLRADIGDKAKLVRAASAQQVQAKNGCLTDNIGDLTRYNLVPKTIVFYILIPHKRDAFGEFIEPLIRLFRLRLC